ncbi:YtxH domain-containing protein [Cytophagaceae bacterium ABcell3]|nr:YtxH domain-containing protein [Cytophagaceae bacterium ABcell3]
MTKSGKFFTGFLIGVAAGTIAGILLAPDNGKSTRTNISSKTNQFKDDVNNTVQKSLDKISAVRESAFTLVNKYGNEVKGQAN